jgi:hypothetical protein
MPTGGDAGQILAKDTATDYDFIWIDNYANWTSQLKHEVKLGEAIAKGQAVYVSSADGTNMIVSKASNATEMTSSKTLGLLETGGSTNAKVKVITEGLLSGLNTATAAAGDPVWLGTSGNLIYGLGSKPVAPDHLVFIGVVTRSNSNNGEIFIKPQNGFELEELHNLVLTDKQNGDVIAWDSANTRWKNVPAQSDTGWTAVTSFFNSYTGSGSPAYRKINNVVYLRGRVSGGGANSLAFNLPAGYRPAVDTVFAVQQFGTGDINYVTVNPDGNVVPNGTAAWLSGVIFPIG